MKLHYYPETDSLYIEFRELPGADAVEVADGITMDVDATGSIIGFDIDRASERLDLASLETVSLPARVLQT